MTLLLQVSDPHFGTEQAPVMQALERLAQSLRPDVLLLSGDITQRARRAQFSRAHAFVGRLRVPAVVAIPGNHDIPLFNLAARMFWPYANHRRAFGRDLEPVFGDNDVLVLTVNTTRWYRHADGEVSAAQIERVAQQLVRARPAQWRIVVVHHPVAVTHASDQHDVLHGHEAAVRRWAAAGADLVVGGHIHLPFVLPLHERCTGLHRAFWAVQAGTAVSDRVRAEAGNSVNVIRVTATPRHGVVERWDYSTASERFERVAVHALSSAAGH